MSKPTAPASAKCFAISFLALGVYSAVLICCFTPGVMVNDDVVMMAFANGDFTGRPEAQLVFIGILIGRILQELYGVSPNLPWYPFLLVFIQVFSASVLLTALISFLGNRVTREFYGVLALIGMFLPTLLLDISFSSTAMFAAINGLIAVSLILRNRAKLNNTLLGLAGMVLVLASSLRFDFLMASCLMFVPLLFLSLVKTKRLVVLLAIPVFLIPVLTHWIESQTAKGGEWSTYLELNRLRGSMHGTPAFNEYSSAAYEEARYTELRKFGWESEDLVLFANWYFEDPSLFNVATLTSLRDSIDISPTQRSFQASIGDIISGREFLIICGLLLCLWICSISSQRHKMILLTQISWFLTTTIYISSRYRFPDRFAIGAWFGIFLTVLITSSMFFEESDVRESDKKGLLSKLAIPLIATLVATNFIPHSFSTFEISKRNLREHEELTKQVRALNAATLNGKTMFIGAQISMAGINPWSDDTFLKGNEFLSLGWPSQSPHQELRKKNMRLDGNLIKRLVDNPNAYVLTDQLTADLLSYSYLRRTGTRVVFKRVKSFPFGSLYRVIEEKRLIPESDSKDLYGEEGRRNFR